MAHTAYRNKRGLSTGQEHVDSRGVRRIYGGKRGEGARGRGRYTLLVKKYLFKSLNNNKTL